MTLHIPDITPDHDPITAALAYAKAGWYVLPVNRATKHAGSVLGKGWPAKSSRDAETIVDWFAGTDHALAIHVGRSGAVCFDVDRPTELPPLLVAVLGLTPPPFQSTRENDDQRGHYLYAAPPDRSLGNSTGGLGKSWGEVRGRNGIIVVAPSEHEKQADGGRYAWQRTGPLPVLPAVLAEQLPDAGDSNDAATDREVKNFLDAHTASTRPELLHGVLTQFNTALATGESRHGIALRATAGAMREAAAGLYPALDAAAALSAAFIAAMRTSRDGAERILPQGQAQAEFLGVLSWAVAQCAAADLAALRTDVNDRLPHDDDFSDLIAPAGPGASGPPPFDTVGNLATVHQLHPEPEQPPEKPAPEEAEELDLEALAYEREVAHELRKLRIREEAARRARRARQGVQGRPAITPLDEFLAVPDEPAQYRIEGLWPVGGRAILAAQFKAGKTTMVGNLMRSLVDSVPFLGCFPVQPFVGRVVLLDDELDERMVRRWLRDQGIENGGGAAVVALRGRLSSFDILDPEVRSEWAADLRAAGASVVVLDCLAPILDALGLSEDKEAGRFLVAFDEMLKEAGVSEAIVVHHMGHSGERSRGASRLRDWPDVEWRLVREKSEDGEMDPAAPRYFSAYGRDVEVAESLLSFDAATRRLELSGGSRRDTRTDRVLEAIVEHLTLTPGQSGRQIETAFKDSEHGREDLRKALKRGASGGVLRTGPGPRGSTLHYVADASKLGSSAPAILKRDDFSDLVNNVSAAQPSAPSAPTMITSISVFNDISPTSAPNPPRTETPGHSVSAPSAPECASALAVSAPVRPPTGEARTGALMTAPEPNPAHSEDADDPSDLIAPSRPAVIAEGMRMDPVSGELLDPKDTL